MTVQLEYARRQAFLFLVALLEVFILEEDRKTPTFQHP